ncbi:MAG TPA: CPBP family glutamic-type intramembrane protease [Ignavibacteria bacterium]|nr:CPBP family glutamic-type intramembrane protease [Ignavibacteria bacterium]
MFLIPVLSIKFVFKQKLSDFGFKLGDVKFGLITSLIFFLVMLPVLFIVSNSPEFLRTYPQGGEQVAHSWKNFILFELSILVYMLGWEFLWRGYMLFGLKPKLGYYSVLIQMIPFFILHKGKPDLELFASIFAGLILGIQALRANSFIYCWLLHFVIMFTIDSISILKQLNYL